MMVIPSVKQRKVFLIVEGKKFLFNVEKLVEVSLFFKNMFNGNFEESRKKEIILKEVDVEEFKFFRDYCNGLGTRIEHLSDEFLIELIYFADRFMVKPLQDHLFQYIEQRLKNDTSEFPYHLIEVFITIGNKQLEVIFTEWFYGTKLRIPQFWKRSDLKSCNLAVRSFFTELQDFTVKKQFGDEVLEKLMWYCSEGSDLLVKQSTSLIERILDIYKMLTDMGFDDETLEPIRMKLLAELDILEN